MLNYHVSVGGLDSIILYLFLHEVCGIDAPGVSASTLEDKSIQRVHKALGIINVPPLKRDDGTYWTTIYCEHRHRCEEIRKSIEKS